MLQHSVKPADTGHMEGYRRALQGATSLYERPDWRRGILIPYAGCCAIALVMLLFGGPVRSEVVPALILQVIVGTLVALAPKLRLDRWPYGGSLAIVAYLVSVALLRDGGGTTAGFGPLVLLPVIWASARGRRDELAVAVVGVALVYIAPAILIGAPRYPAGSWRSGVMFAVISATIGITVIQLVRKVQRLIGEMALLAGTDELTGLANRRAWKELLTRELNLASRSGKPLSVVLIDLDFFKDYNDKHGHLAGDRLLLGTTSAWHRVLRETDVLARWGGDEFSLLLPACNARQALDVIERLRAAFPELQFSAGVAEWQAGDTAQELLTAADEALYKAKNGERNSSAIAPAS
jgi:diguanylate cyclase (GGDEF)-like protein